jgi:hypothetical protein
VNRVMCCVVLWAAERRYGPADAVLFGWGLIFPGPS